MAATLPLFNEADLSPQAFDGNNPYLERLQWFARSRLARPKFNLISLFCGGGGLDLGLSFAGFGSRVCSDLAPAFVSTVDHNIPHVRSVAGYAMSLSPCQFLSLAGTKKVDLIAAGPPCQSFSILGRRGALADPRGKLALKYFDLVSEIKPRAFLFENVPGLLSVNKGEDWSQLLDYAKRVTRYHIFHAKLNASMFGVPQQRERVVMVGFRESRSFEFPTKPTGAMANELMEVIFRGGTPSYWALSNVDGLPNHHVRVHGESVRKRYSKILPGDRDRTDHTDRIDGTRPSGTVLVGSSAGGGRPHIHPTEDRVITVREAARLQSFPDWYEFLGTNTAQYRQIGNAVPPLLAYEVGREIRKSLER